MSTWALFASRRRLSGIGAAGDQDQARLLRDAISRLLYLNPWLHKLLEVQNYRVVNPRTDSTLEIISSDAPTSYGLTPDFCICDEVVHWKKRDLWDSLLSSSAKRASCMLVCISNAGLSDDWTWQLREAVRNDPKWYFSRLEGPVASWITKDRLEEQERLLPSIAYRRLWLNEWTSGAGDALTGEDIAAAFKPNIGSLMDAMRVETVGYSFVGGLDLGVSRDASALCVLGIKRGHGEHGKIRLAFTKVWRPRRGIKIDLTDVENTLIKVHTRFKLNNVAYDPWQAEHLSQRLKQARIPMQDVPFTQSKLQQMATAVLEAFNDRRLELYDDGDLKRDLSRMRVEERPSGFRMSFPRDNLGHGDLGQAFLLALFAASDLAAQPRQEFWIRIDGRTHTFGHRQNRSELDAESTMQKLLDSGAIRLPGYLRLPNGTLVLDPNYQESKHVK
jgi:phage terminase large subunit-like protein